MGNYDTLRTISTVTPIKQYFPPQLFRIWKKSRQVANLVE